MDEYLNIFDVLRWKLSSWAEKLDGYLAQTSSGIDMNIFVH